MPKLMKWAPLLMALLLLVQVGIAPVSMVSAAVNEQDKTLVGGVDLTNSDGSALNAQNEIRSTKSYKFYANLDNKGTNAFNNGKIVIKLLRRDFAEPASTDIAKPTDDDASSGYAGKLAGSQIVTTDPDYWIIVYDLKEIGAGEGLRIPTIVQASDENVDGTQGAIVEEIQTQTGAVVNTAQQGYRVDTDPMIAKGFGASATDVSYYYSYQGEADTARKEADGSYTTLTTAGGSANVYYLYDTYDSRPVTMTIDLSTFNALAFDDDQSNGWQYNAATKIATKTFSRAEFKDNTARKFYVKAQAGATIPATGQASELFGYQIQYANSTAILYKGQYNLHLKIETGQSWNPHPAGQGMLAATGATSAYLSEVSDQTPIQYAVESAGQYLNYDHIPSGVELPVTVLKVTLPDTFYEENTLRGFSLHLVGGRELAGMTNNQLYGLKADGTKELITKNLTAASWSAAGLTQHYTGFQLEFQEPVMLTNKDATFGFNVLTTLTQATLDDFRNDKTAYTRSYGLEKPEAKYQGYYEGDFSYYVFSNLTLNKYAYHSADQPPYITPADKDDSLTVLNGHDFNIKRRFFLYNNFSKVTLANAQVYFFVPERTQLAKDQSSLSGMADVQVIPNFHNSGRTAVVGKLVPEITPSGYTDIYSVNVPLNANNLRQGDNYQIESYVVFSNNDGDYDLNNPAAGSSIVTPALPSDPYQIYTDTKAPSKGLKLVTTTLNYAPVEGLQVTSLVAKGTGGYSTNLGTAGNLGDEIKYRTNLFNGYNKAADSVGLVNYLPIAGANQSQVSVSLTGPVQVTDQTPPSDVQPNYSQSFDIYYSFATPTYAANDYQRAGIWQQASELTAADYRRVTMIKIALKTGITFDPQADVNFDYPAQIAADPGIPEFAPAYNQVRVTRDAGVSYAQENQSLVTINYPTSAVQATVRDSITGAPLYGAQFKLLDADAQQVGTDIYATNASGQVQISDLKPGAYFLQQVAAPTGYHLPAAAQTAFSITATQQAPTLVALTNTPVKIPQGSLKMTNRDATSDALLSGGVFSISRLDGQQETPIASGLTVGASGELMQDGLTVGDYLLKQTTAPAGYELNGAAMKFTVTADQQTTITFKNELAPVIPTMGSFTVQAQDKTTKAPLAGASFAVVPTIAAGQLQLATSKNQTLTTDQTGRATLTYLLLGEYRLTEIAAPTDYQSMGADRSFTLDGQHLAPVMQIDYEATPAVVPPDPGQPEVPPVPEVPLVPSVPADPQNPGGNEIKDHAKTTTKPSVKNEQTRLPQAGERSLTGLFLTGILILTLGTVIVFQKRWD